MSARELRPVISDPASGMRFGRVLHGVDAHASLIKNPHRVRAAHLTAGNELRVTFGPIDGFLASDKRELVRQKVRLRGRHVLGTRHKKRIVDRRRVSNEHHNLPLMDAAIAPDTCLVRLDLVLIDGPVRARRCPRIPSGVAYWPQSKRRSSTILFRLCLSLLIAVVPDVHEPKIGRRSTRLEVRRVFPDLSHASRFVPTQTRVPNDIHGNWSVAPRVDPRTALTTRVSEPRHEPFACEFCRVLVIRCRRKRRQNHHTTYSHDSERQIHRRHGSPFVNGDPCLEPIVHHTKPSCSNTRRYQRKPRYDAVVEVVHDG